jgi:hypothetical protein
VALQYPCISRDQFVNKLKSLGFRFSDQLPRIEQYRRPSPLAFANVPRSDYISEEHVRSTLRQAGETSENIESFIASARVSVSGKKPR